MHVPAISLAPEHGLIIACNSEKLLVQFPELQVLINLFSHSLFTQELTRSALNTHFATIFMILLHLRNEVTGKQMKFKTESSLHNLRKFSIISTLYPFFKSCLRSKHLSIQLKISH